MDMNMKLSENFTLGEFLKSQTAERRGISNVPTQDHLDNAFALFENVAQPVRDHFGPTIVSSGYRSPELNAAIGGAPRSQHQRGEAVDLVIPGVTTAQVCEWIVNNLTFDQVILEFYDPGDPSSGWTHVSYTRYSENRGEVLTATRVNGTTEYSYGLNY